MRRHAKICAVISIFVLIVTMFCLGNEVSAGSKSPGDCSGVFESTEANLARRNSLLRMSALQQYHYWLYQSPPSVSSSFAIAVISERRSDLPTPASDRPSPEVEAAHLQEELKNLDGTCFQERHLSCTGHYLVLDSHSSRSTMRTRALDVAEGVARVTPLLTLIASPYVFGPASDLFSSPGFWITNIGVMLASWAIFPELTVRVSKAEQQAYKLQGDISAGIEARRMGSIFESAQREAILKTLLMSVNEFSATVHEQKGIPVFAFLMTPDIAELLALHLSRNGFQPRTIHQVWQTPIDVSSSER